MRIPKKIKGYYEDIELIPLSQEEINKLSDKEEKIMGYYDGNKTIYYIINDETLNTILHELGHYFFMKFGISSEEFVAEAFANFLESVCKQLGLVK